MPLLALSLMWDEYGRNVVLKRLDKQKGVLEWQKRVSEGRGVFVEPAETLLVLICPAICYTLWGCYIKDEFGSNIISSGS